MKPLPNTHPPVVSPEEWRAGRAAMLVKEKGVLRAHDAFIESAVSF